MAKEKLPSKQNFLDPVVEDTLGVGDIFGDMRKKRRAMSLTPGQAKKVDRDKNRSRRIYDLPEPIATAAETYAKNEGIPASQLVALLIVHGIQDLLEGRIELEKTPSRSPLFEFNLVLPEPPLVNSQKEK
jgi:hypothetical protein